ncbi:MAG: DUF1893 domain-containing protein [Clostridiales bacterium]|nr:DUF1893 domain-containing protein [Clostridiales bacterium]
MIDKGYAEGLLGGETRCAVIKGDKKFTSTKRGIAPLIELAGSGEDYSGGFAADRKVGKAAALIYAHVGIRTLYAAVLSKAALSVLDRYGIEYAYGTLAEYIINRSGDGLCPMEQTVRNIDDPDEALIKLQETVQRLQAKA